MFTLGPPQFDATDRQLVAATARDVRVFSTENPDAALTVTADQYVMNAWFLDGPQFATAGETSLRLWNRETGAAIDHVDGVDGRRSMISRDGKWLVTYSATGDELQLYDVATHTVRRRIPSEGVELTGFSADSTKLAVANPDHSIDVWSVTGERIAHLVGHTGTIAYTAFAPDGRLMSMARDRTFRIWDIASQRTVAQTRADYSMRYAGLSMSGRRVIATHSRVAQLYDATTMVPIGVFEHDGYVGRGALNPEDDLLATVASDHVQVRDVRTGALVVEFSHGELATSATFSADGTRVLSSSVDKTATLWRVDRETRPAAVVNAFVRCHAPYRLVETRLEPAEPVCD